MAIGTQITKLKIKPLGTVTPSSESRAIRTKVTKPTNAIPTGKVRNSIADITTISVSFMSRFTNAKIGTLTHAVTQMDANIFPTSDEGRTAI